MKTLKTTKQFVTILLVTILLSSCNQKPIDSGTTIDDVLLPAGFVQSEDMSSDMKARLDELRLKNAEDDFYYLKLKDGSVKTEKELIFPQNEMKIESMDEVRNTDGTSKYKGVIVKRIKDKWTDELFQYYDKKAEPKGGMEAFKTLLKENLKYPEEAKKEKIEGKVFVQFIVQKDGSPRMVQAVKGIGAGCDEEAVRFIINETEWNPAEIMGENVESRMILPIVYKLD
jgi:TonB family protein